MVDLRFRIEHYRAKAAEAEEHARQAKDPDARAMYLQIAQSWRMLAENAEEMERDRKKQG
jgi:hypothetical protein